MGVDKITEKKKQICIRWFVEGEISSLLWGIEILDSFTNISFSSGNDFINIMLVMTVMTVSMKDAWRYSWNIANNLISKLLYE